MTSATRSRPACGPEASPPRSPPRPQKFGKQIRYAERRGIPFVWFPGDQHEVKDIRSGEPGRRRPGRVESARRGPQTPRQGAAPVIRTHDAGSLRAENIGDRVTLAGWVARRRDHGGVAFIDLREASGVVQVVVREDVAHQLRAEYCLRVTRHGREATGGQRELRHPHRRHRGDRRRRRDPQRGRRTAVPDRRVHRRRRGGAAQAPLPRPPPRRARRGDPAAQQGQPGRPRRARRPRLRRDRDADAHAIHARGRPRLPGARPGCARAAGTRCRRARSCSSSC